MFVKDRWLSSCNNKENILPLEGNGEKQLIEHGRVGIMQSNQEFSSYNPLVMINKILQNCISTIIKNPIVASWKKMIAKIFIPKAFEIIEIFCNGF